MSGRGGGRGAESFPEVPEQITVWVSGVAVGISLRGCRPEVGDAVVRHYVTRLPSVPVSPDIRVCAPADADVEATLQALSEEVSAAVASIHRDRGLIDFGAPALLGDNGSAVIVIAGGSDDANAALAGLASRFEVLPSQSWSADLSGAVVRHDGPRVVASGERSPGRRSARLVGALLLGGSGDPRTDGDEVIALAQHVIEHGAMSKRAPLLRSVRTIAESAPGIRRIPSRELTDLPAALVRWLEQGERAPRFAAPASIHSIGPAGLPVSGIDIWFRGSGVDCLLRPDDVLIVRWRRDRFELDVLTGHAGALWKNAEGTRREELFRVAAYPDPVTDEVRTALEAAFDKLRDDGLLLDEPSWAVRPNVAWSSSPTHVFVLDAAGPLAQPLALEGSAKVIWEAIVEGAPVTLTGIVDHCAEVYDVDAAVIRPEVQRLVGDLHHRELIGWI